MTSLRLRKLIALLLALCLLPACALAETAADVPVDELLIGGGNPADDIDFSAMADAPTLQLGDKDDEDSMAYIVFMQNRLIRLGYLEDAADGAYGKNTEAAVANFQAHNGMPATGIADRATMEKLFSKDGSVVAAGPTGGADTGDIARVQARLAQWGFLTSAIDGRYGDYTAAAIEHFKRYILAVEGAYNPSPTPLPAETPAPSNDPFDMPVPEDIPVEVAQQQIDAAMNGDIDETLLAYANGEIPFPLFREALESGSTGLEVRRVQSRLMYLGYLYGVDGEYGGLTEHALMYFQRKNKLPETGKADEQTQQALFSEAAKRSEEYVFPYKLIVDVSDQRVYALQWTGSDYSQLYRKMICSTGTTVNPTPLGTYQAGGRAGGEWYYFKKYNCYAKWATRIVGGILFHSVTYSSGKSLNYGSVYNLGHRASHGCVRLKVEDAKWVYDHCPAGTTVVVRK